MPVQSRYMPDRDLAYSRETQTGTDTSGERCSSFTAARLQHIDQANLPRAIVVCHAHIAKQGGYAVNLRLPVVSVRSQESKCCKNCDCLVAPALSTGDLSHAHPDSRYGHGTRR
jgi:hypothetical protein